MPAHSGAQNQTPPFLTKTYDMLNTDDEKTKSIISWSNSGDSFIIWKPIEFQADLLASHFKHNNLSSFVRQLNTYGFRKIDPDKYEFQNENFIRGRKDLLQSIHRRKPPKEKDHDNLYGHENNAVQQYNNLNTLQVDPSQMQQLQNLPGIVENLQRDKNVLMVEIIRLRQQQQSQHSEMLQLQKHLNKSDRLIQKVILAFRQIIQYPEVMNKIIDFNARKKRKLSEEQQANNGQPSPNQQLVQYGLQNELLGIFDQMLSDQKANDQVHVAQSQPQQPLNGSPQNNQQNAVNNGQNVVITEVPLNFSAQSTSQDQQDPQSSSTNQQHSSKYQNVDGQHRANNNYFGNYNEQNSDFNHNKSHILPQSSFEISQQQIQNSPNNQNTNMNNNMPNNMNSNINNNMQNNMNSNMNSQYSPYIPSYDQGSVDILNEALDGLLDDETITRLTSLDLQGGMGQGRNLFNNELDDYENWQNNSNSNEQS